MIRIAHRRNTIEELRSTPKELGIEIDIRSEGARLIVVHDPFQPGIDFDEWLAHFDHKTLILNVKEEGLEDALLKRMVTRGVTDFFFLDQSFPFLLKTARAGERRCAVRVSEYESIETALSLTGLIDWVWVDVFTRFALTGREAARLKAAGFRLCLVSPELQGRWDEREIDDIKATCMREGIELDAVCTKRPQCWP